MPLVPRKTTTMNPLSGLLGKPNDTASDDVYHFDEWEEPFVMLFLFGGLGLGLILQTIMQTNWIRHHINVPFTVLLMLTGLIIGVMIHVFSDNPDTIYRHYTMADTNPKLIMYIFLPILIFESSFRMEAHSVFKALGQIACLASVGLLITAFIIAGFMYLIVNKWQGIAAWTPSICLVFGSILSATDPVAVVSLLRELGAPRQVVILTEGESLFNDGAAIIAYEIFMKVSEQQAHNSTSESTSHVNVAGTIGMELFGILISPLIGFVVAKTCEILLQRTFNKEIREKGIILIAVYFTFFICEQLGVSGVLALCVLGIWLSLKKNSISPETLEDNSRFWDFFSYWANVLVFILAGLVIAKPIHSIGRDVGNYAYIFLIYLVINFARAVSIFLLYPMLKRIGYGINRRHAIVLVWGGLRGAIALVLSLQMLESSIIRGHTHMQTDIGDKVLLYVSGCVALTLLVNATTFRFVLRFFRMDLLPRHKVKVMANVATYLKEIQQSTIQQLKEDRFLAEANWDLVDRLTTVKNPYANHSERKEVTIMKKLRSGSIQSVNDELAVAAEEARQRVLQVEKVSYWRQFNKGLLSNRAINLLSDAVDEAAETTGAHLEVDALKKNWKVGRCLTLTQHRIQAAHDRHVNALEMERSILPKSKWRRSLAEFLTDLKTELIIFIFILVAFILFTLECVGVLSAHEKRYEWHEAIRIVIYVILLINIALKLLGLGINYFKLPKNWFDALFLVMYFSCLVSLATKLREEIPSLYYFLEILASIRVFRLVFIMPYVLPKMLETVNSKINESVGLSYDTAKGFIIGEEDTNKHIRRLIDNDHLAEAWMKRCKKRRLEAIRHLAQLQVQQPGAAVSVKTKQASQFCLNRLQETLHEMKEAGIVDDKEYEILHKLIEELMLSVQKAPPWIEAPKLEKQLQQLNWVNNNQELLEEIMAHSELREYPEGQTVFRQGDQSDGMYIIASGMMKVIVTRDRAVVTEEYLYAGRYFGEIGVITGEPRSGKVVAEVNSTTYFIPTETVLDIVKNHEDIYWQFVLSYCISKSSDVLQDNPTFSGWTDVKLKTHLAHGDFIDLTEQGKYCRRNENEFIILIRGELLGPSGKRRFKVRQGLAILIPTQLCSVQQYNDDPCWIFVVPPYDNMQFEGLSRNKSFTDLAISRKPSSLPVTGPGLLMEALSPRRTPFEGSKGIYSAYISTSNTTTPKPPGTPRPSISIPNGLPLGSSTTAPPTPAPTPVNHVNHQLVTTTTAPPTPTPTPVNHQTATTTPVERPVRFLPGETV